MKIPGENFFFEVIGKLHSRLGKRKFVREVIKNDGELNYGQMRSYWNDKRHKVHGDMTNPEYYFSCINEVLAFKEADNVVDIGCGDGIIDSYIHVNNLYGIDFSSSKLSEAKKRNPNYAYHEQSFLDRIVPADNIIYNKCFSYGVAQYCAPEDMDILLKNSIDCILGEQEKKYPGGHRKIVAHLEIPDLGKAYEFYHRRYGIKEEFFLTYKNKVRTIFSDGSYWHDMKAIKEKALRYIEEKNAGETAIVYVSDCHCWYRSNLVILFI